MSEYKYIYFAKTGSKAKTSLWFCRNKNSDTQLGVIRWHPAWRQYCYFPTTEAVYSAGCLDDISDFIKQEMVKRKKL